MIKYNNEWLKNLSVRDSAAELYHDNCINKTELELIEARFPVQFYTPNFFIRIGLFVLTIIILFFSFGLFALIFLDSSDHAIGALSIFFGLLSFAGLEYMVRIKNHYRSGVDDALLWISAICLFGGISYLADADPFANCVLGFIISLCCVARFTNRWMVPVMYFSLLGIFFFAATRSGVYGRLLVPFILMGVSIVTYMLINKLRQRPQFLLYNSCLQVTRICALICFYIACNYFVVRELSNEVFDLHLADNQGIALGWVFWIFTCSIPILYLTRGIQKKDVVLLRIGLLLIAAVIFTIKYFFYIASIEATITVIGITLAGVAYALSVFLKKPKFGFTAHHQKDADEKQKIDIESLVLAQTFGKQEAVADVTTFGGGSFGGGGASGDF